ncbi:MAG: DNA primase catalytic subunit PriS [Ferroplasma sp.]|uniref:DNA primase catalytic subunit PriS n=1 Tax=Ferroplasma sp. TaxID=2591003 RepID=UPI0028151ACD|nr:DNA primase catalytic subunit PriS [Ferroplasma sp.]WMT52082.1 MAG: DNA primase catalytic subunit PriS [Ferroplasma sp.]
MPDDILKQYFRKYYSTSSLGIPDMLFQREIGFIPFNGTMIRHKKFSGQKPIERFVRQYVPRHLYYSSAYYRFPDQHKMMEKEWLGAELIFDLDADHIEGANKMTYMEILAEVKKHTIRLLEMLMNDFGFGENNIRLYFSGGRGYHVHVESDKIYTMDSDSRRDIGDYIRIEGLNIEDLKMLDDSYFNYGILGRFNRYIADFYSNIDENYVKSVFGKSWWNYMNYLEKFYNGEKIIDFLKKVEGNKFKLLIKKSNSNENASVDYDRIMLGKLLQDFKKNALAEIDEPVTTDIHRLIRFPFSLHGKTGLMVKPVQLDSLKSFNPLNEAIPEVFKNSEININMKINKFSISMNGENYSIEKGENRVPLYLGIFTSAINVADFIPE